MWAAMRPLKGKFMKTVQTFTASIYVGFRVRYSEKLHSIEEVRDWIKIYCNETGFCVTITPLEFIYTHSPASGCVGYEPGCVIGIINYPRFPSTPQELKDRCLVIAVGLQKLCEQGKVSVVFPDETVMLGE